MNKDSSEVELFTSGSFKEIAQKMELDWWEESRKKIDKLSKEIGFDIIEVLPDEYRQNYILSKEELDEENQEDRFYLKTFPPSKSGNEWEIICSNDVFKSTKKITKKEKDEVLDILNGLSQEPSGSMLPRPQNVKTLGKGGRYLEKQFGLTRDNENPQRNKIYQYKCGNGRNKRCIWTPKKSDKKITILFYGGREKLNNLYT
jgi:hypothetical protein